MKYSYVYYDWKQGGCEEEYEQALKDFGLVMTADPLYEGSDSFAFFITEKELTDEEIRELMIATHGKELIEELEEDLEEEEE